MTDATAKTVYQTVAKLGISRAQARKLLPAWWSVDVETEAGGVDELMMLLARRLSLDVKALSAGVLEPRGAMEHVAFKRRASLDPEALTSTSHVASSVAALVCAAMPRGYSVLPATPREIAAASLAGADSLVGFNALLSLCWRTGIPVIHLTNLPVGMRKMDGAALSVDGRPAIILARRQKSRAWLSFILAHELAHIALGHLRSGSIIDVSLQEEATYAIGAPADDQEADADRFALDILGGDPTTAEVSNWPQRLSPAEIASRARIASTRLNVEAGNVVLRYAFITRRWPEAAMALNFLTEDFDASKALAAALEANVSFEDLGEDAQEYLRHVTGAEAE